MKDKVKIRDFLKNKRNIVLIVIIVIGSLLRVIGIDKFPIGLNCDEASSAYDAFSILNYGIDRNGNFLPVYLKAWGSGQSVLYSYFSIPFIKILGLNIISTRLPMAIIGCISLWVWYLLLKNIKDDEKFAIIGVAFLAICPWHIMKSRWGMEANMFPDIVLLAIYFITCYLKTNKIFKLYIAFVLLGLSAYTYGTSYFFLPFFCMMLFIFLLYKKQVKIKDVIISIGILALIAFPIMLYVIINTFDLPQINLPFMTIPRLVVNRYEEQTTLFSGNILLNALKNIKSSFLLLILQNDNLAWNNVKGFGMYYIVSVPVLIIGLIFSFKKSKLKYENDSIINIWFLSSFLLLFVFKEANINKINILIFPLIYYVAKGLYLIVNMKKVYINIAILLIYLANFTGFIFCYVNMNPIEYWTFTKNVQEVIEYVDKIDAEKVYYEYAFKEPFINVLFYTNYNAHDFIDTVQYFDENGWFDNVKAFGKYNFYLPDSFDEENCVYVIKKNNNLDLDYSNFDVKEFEKYIVLRGK